MIWWSTKILLQCLQKGTAAKKLRHQRGVRVPTTATSAGAHRAAGGTQGAGYKSRVDGSTNGDLSKNKDGEEYCASCHMIAKGRLANFTAPFVARSFRVFSFWQRFPIRPLRERRQTESAPAVGACFARVWDHRPPLASRKPLAEAGFEGHGVVTLSFAAETPSDTLPADNLRFGWG